MLHHILRLQILWIALQLPGASLHRPLPQQKLTAIPAGPFHVAGSRIVDAQGRPFLIRGTQLPVFHLRAAVSATTLSTIRLRFNMNAVRIPVNVLEDYNDPAWLAELSRVVRRANELELLVILAAQEPGVDLPSRRTARFWSRCAAFFKDNPNVFFDVFSDPHPAAVPAGPHATAGWQFWLHGGQTRDGREAIGFEDLVKTIRAAGARQPIVAMGWRDEALLEGMTPELFINDPDIIYEVCPRFRTTQTDADRDAQFGFLARRVPVLANDWDLGLDQDSADCRAIPPDPAVAEAMVKANLDYFDAHDISWTASVFQPGKLITDDRYLFATTLQDGWTCGQPGAPPAGMGRAVQFHLWSGEAFGLFTVTNPTGSMVLARGGIAAAYGPIGAEAELGAAQAPLPKRLGNISVRVTDSAGVARLASLLHTSAGWGYINFIVPPGSARGPAEIAILRSDGTSVAGNSTIDDVSPGLYTATADGHGPVAGWVTQKSADGKTKTFPAFECKAQDCRTVPIVLSDDVSTIVRLPGTGFRHTGPAPDVRVTVGDLPVPVISFHAADAPGADDLIIQLPPRLGGPGETDLLLSVNGRPANIVRINVQAKIPRAYHWDLPKGFPRPRVPAANPMTTAKVKLGRYLFYDKRMSGNGTQSCATCHRQELAFTDGKPRAEGSTGEVHPRSAMSLVNVAYSGVLTWSNPGLHTLEEQALTPMFGRHPVELGLSGRAAAVRQRLRADNVYRAQFPAAFPGQPDPFTIANITKAIAAFERTIISARSPYDRYHYQGDEDALSDAAKRGEVLFFSDRAGCFRCHGGFNFSDVTVFEGSHSKVEFHNTGLYETYPPPNVGIYAFTKRPADAGKFKAPSLRNIALTAPYMHDGSIATLEGVLDHYAAGGRAAHNPHKDSRIKPLRLTPRNREDLLAFLRSLTDAELTRDPRFSNPW